MSSIETQSPLQEPKSYPLKLIYRKSDGTIERVSIGLEVTQENIQAARNQIERALSIFEDEDRGISSFAQTLLEIISQEIDLPDSVSPSDSFSGFSVAVLQGDLANWSIDLDHSVELKKVIESTVREIMRTLTPARGNA